MDLTRLPESQRELVEKLGSEPLTSIELIGRTRYPNRRNVPVEPLTRRGIEKVRIRVTLACLVTAVEKKQRKPPVRHLWFPEDNLNKYSLRDGNPPADVDRPKHLKGHHLVIDLGVIPRKVWDAVKEQRRSARRMSAEPSRMVDLVDDPRIIEHVRNLREKALLPKA